MFGWAGNLLRVDLSSGEISVEELGKDELVKYLGGKCLGVKILLEELEPGIDPLGEENKLIFLNGPLNGPPIPASGRFAVVTKAPLTGSYGESQAGGTFGPVLKKAGYDCIVIEGISEEPVYLHVGNDEIELKKAENLWGKNVDEVETIIDKEIKPKPSICSIGIAGEKLVKFASIVNDRHRVLGRQGVGAVMGSKKLKAIAVNRRKGFNLYDKTSLKEYLKELFLRLKEHHGMINRGEYGTAGFLSILNELGVLPTKNFQQSIFDGHEKIDGHRLHDTLLVGRKGCYACPVRCIRIVEVKTGPFAPVHPRMGGPEYETLAALGSFLLNDDLASICKASELCNDYGIDTISTGNVIGFMMECIDKELFSKEKLDGIDLTWGNAEAIITMIHKIGNREGIGDMLAEGVKRISEKIGKGTEKFAMHIKGLEIPMHEPRAKKGVGLCYAVAPQGGIHLLAEHDHTFEKSTFPEIGITKTISRFSSEGQPQLYKQAIKWWAVVDSLIFCKFIAPVRAMTFSDVTNLLKLVTGHDFSLDDLLTIGERAFNMSRVFSVREGFSREDDRFPERYAEPIPEGTSANANFSNDELQKVLDEFYHLVGWDVETGIPTKEKLNELGLGWAVQKL